MNSVLQYTGSIGVCNLQTDFVCAFKNIPIVTFLLILIVISFSGLTIALSSLFLCQHWLDKTPQITNPIKHIAKVLNYARKNKYPRNRSASPTGNKMCLHDLTLVKINMVVLSQRRR